MTTDLDITQLREQLLKIYTKYLNNPSNQNVKEVGFPKKKDSCNRFKKEWGCGI